MRADRLTSARAVRAAFWRECSGLPGVTRRRIRNHAGNGLMHDADTRAAFCDWLDAATRDGRISESLAQRVTLSGD